MKSKCSITSWLVLAALATLSLQPATALAQGTAFTYQGRLNNDGAPANGSYDFRFRLASDPYGNNYVDSPVLTNGVAVSNGLFLATIDFGSVFTGTNYWLEVDVRTNGAGAYTVLSPLQPLTPAPYAIMANTASNLLGTLSAAQLSAGTANISISGNAATAIGFTGSLLGDVTGTQSATAVAQVGGQTAANVASGASAANAATSVNTASTIVKRDGSGNFAAGTITATSLSASGDVLGSRLNVGSGHSLSGNNTTIAGGNVNSVASGADYSGIGSGVGNSIGANAYHCFLGGGAYNTIQAGANRSVLGGGQYNSIQTNCDHSFLGGGYQNSILSNATSVVLAAGNGIPSRPIRTTRSWAAAPSIPS